MTHNGRTTVDPATLAKGREAQHARDQTVADKRAAEAFRQRVNQRASELKLAAEAAEWQALLDQAEAELLAHDQP